MPAPGLQDHIAAYWVRRTGRDAQRSGRRVYADGCADLIYNGGDSPAWFNPMARPEEMIPLYPGQLYLGGTMTAYGIVRSEPGCLLTGIRFRPGGFYAFYGITMEPAVDAVIGFSDGELAARMSQAGVPGKRLDQWFKAKIVSGRSDFAGLCAEAYRTGGQITVDELATRWHMSNRTLERVFKEHVGIPPKEFLRIVRFQEVLKRLPVSGESLLRIAFELGYYDHAHLTNEFKKYSGVLPSELSHFYKTGIAGGRYF